MNTPQDESFFQEVFLILSGLSILAELFIIASYLSIRKRTTIFYNQVVWFFISDMISFASYFYSLEPDVEKNDTGCHIAAFVNELFTVLSIAWTSIIAGTIFYSMKTKRRMTSLRKGYVIITIIICFIFPIYPLVRGEYGLYEGFSFPICWITFREFSTLVIGYWVPLICSVIFNFICYIGILILLKKNELGASKEFSILLIFPLLQMLGNSGSLLCSIYYLKGDPIPRNAQLYHVVTRSVGGLLNAIAYGLNPSIRNDLKKAWQRRKFGSNGSFELQHSNSSVLSHLTYPSMDAASVEVAY